MIERAANLDNQTTNVVSDLLTRSLVEVAGLIQRREVSPVELTGAMLDRIEALDSELHSYITVAAELARRQAKKAEAEILRGEYLGPLHGIPIAVKDLILTKGVRTTCASKILADWMPDYDATVIKKLYSSGAVLLGKLSLTEFAGIGYHPSVTPPLNPWDKNRWPGSSSSGSAVATAAALCYGSLGTDTGGSLRFPAAACGVVGLKPTYGRVSRYGVFPLAESLDHVGPMARSVTDAALILRAVAGFDAKDPTSLCEPAPDILKALEEPPAGLRIGIDWEYCTVGVDEEIKEALAGAVKLFEGLGASVEAVNMTLIEEAIAAWGMIFAAECVAAHEATYPARDADYSPAFRAFLNDGGNVRGVDYAKAHATRQKVRRMVELLLGEVDLLLCPTMGLIPLPLGGRPFEEVISPERAHDLLRFTSPFSLTGNPAVAVPAGFNRDGLPLSLQIIGRFGDELTALRAAHAYEQATEWHLRRPVL
jgi:amidase